MSPITSSDCLLTDLSGLSTIKLPIVTYITNQVFSLSADRLESANTIKLLIDVCHEVCYFLTKMYYIKNVDPKLGFGNYSWMEDPQQSSNRGVNPYN
jgi:hypothetical protein